MSVTKTWSRNMGRLAIDPDETGLVAGYDMIPRADGTIEDKAGNGNHGTIDGPGFEYTEIGPSMRFAANGEMITTTYTGAPAAFSISKWVNLRSSGQGTFGRLFSKGANVLELFINNSAADLNLRYENGSGVQNAVIADGYVQDLECHIVLTYASGSIKLYLNNTLVDTVADSVVLDSSALVLGNLSVNAMDGNISNFKFFELALTASEIQAEYQRGAKAINWKSDYGVSESTAAESAPGELSNSPARVISGSFEMSTDTINGCAAKVIKCVTVGVVAIPSAYFHGNDTQAAYGTFEWWILKGNENNTSRIGFISSTTPAGPTDPSFTGYEFLISSSESLILTRRTLGSASLLMSTAASYVSILEWLKTKITRSHEGELTLYMDDTLVDVTGGSGTNPITDANHTTSKYIVFDLDAGDKIGWSAKNGSCAIVKYQGVV